MALIDSEASFAARALSFGISQSDIDALRDQKYCSFGAFTFIATYQPNSADDTALKAALNAVLGSEPTSTVMGKWRRLHFESHALTVADARSRVEGSSDDPPKKMPAPERAARYEQQKSRLTGLIWTSALEPSNALVDRIQQQFEENQGAFVSLELCTSRLQELSGVKKDKEISAAIEPSHLLKITSKEPDIKASLASDLALRQAFRRRALAYDQCNLVSFEVLEIWAEKLFASMEQIPPPGYSQVTRFQITAADKELFVKVLETCRAGIVPTISPSKDGGNIVRPMQAAIERLIDDPTVLFHLLALPISGSGNRKKLANIDEEMDEEEHQPKKHKPANGPGKAKVVGKGKGKGKGKSKGKADKLPPALTGCWKLIKGKPGCKWFNVGTCHSQAAAGEECKFGIHLCMSPGCGLPHPAFSCDKNPALKRANQ